MRRRDLTRRPFALLALVAGVSAAAACSSDTAGTDAVATTDVPSSTEEGSAPTTTPPNSTGPSTDEDPDESPAPWSVRVDYAIVAADGGNGGRDGVEGTLDPQSGAPLDPFDDLASCSGWRDSVTAYSLFVHGDDATRFVSVSVADAVTGAGTYDALVRVERDGTVFDFVGTATLTDDLQTGEFVAFGAAGERVDGAFRCEGTDSPRPLELGDPADDQVDTVEVTALLRHEGRSVIVGLATDAADGAVCDVTGDQATLSVSGGPGIGSMTSFDLATDPAGLSVIVGGTSHEFGSLESLDVMVDDSSRASGTFGADADGVEIDGAFRCT